MYRIPIYSGFVIDSFQPYLNVCWLLYSVTRKVCRFLPRTNYASINTKAILNAVVLSKNISDTFNKCLHLYVVYSIVQLSLKNVVAVDLQLPMQSVPITTDVWSSNLNQGKVYDIM